MAIKEYFDTQKENLKGSCNWEPFARVFPLVDKLYVDAIALVPRDRPHMFGQVLLLCHKSFLTAASLVGQAEPSDAGPITRRAIEAAHVAAVAKTNPKRIEEWLAFDKRAKRWADRQEGEKPKRLHVNLGEVHDGIKPIFEEMMGFLGVYSDADVHFTPEFFAQLDWEKREDAIYLNYFTRDQDALKREIVFTSASHLLILQVIDWCYDGAFMANRDWAKLVDTLRQTAAPLTKKTEEAAASEEAVAADPHKSRAPR